MIVIAIGKNYVNTAEEMPTSKGAPVIFTKPESSVLTGNAPFEIPKAITNVAYEVELAFRVHKKGKLIDRESAMDYVDAVALAIDFTGKDLLNQVRETKGPWALAKGFDGATPLSAFLPLSELPDIHAINFTLDLNGERVQNGTSTLMIHTLPEILEYVTQFMTINPGDVILTGTPAHGTGFVNPGDQLTAKLEGKEMLDFKVI